MKRKGKTGCESLRNRDVVSKDMISELPDALLLKILSSVPTKDVVATSVLSKRWRSVWKMVPTLKFESETDHVSSADVYRLLMLHQAPVLESLHLNIGDTKGRLDIGILIAVAFSRHVRELVVDLYNENYEAVRFPQIKYPTGCIFYQLVSLELHIKETNGWNLLSVMLDSSPKLQYIKINSVSNYFGASSSYILMVSHVHQSCQEDCPVGWEWSQPKCVPECLLLHLETLVWRRYGWKREEEKQVATYILENARQLKKATFDPSYVKPKPEELNVLVSVARASTSCLLVFEPVGL